MTATTLTAENETHPADILMRVVVNLLAPMFLTTRNGDICFARMAAFETVNQFRPRNHVHLLAIAQIIAFSMAAVGSLSLSLGDTLTLAMTIRLRANAAALNRAVEQNRRALREAAPDSLAPAPPFVPDPNQAAYEEQVLADVAAVAKRSAEALSRLKTEPVANPPAKTDAASTRLISTLPASNPSLANRAAAASQPPIAPIASPAAQPQITDEEWQAKWASAMTEAAHEFTAELQNLSPAEHLLAVQRTTMLSDITNKVLAGNVPSNLRPGAEHQT